MYRQPSKKRQLTERVVVSVITTASVLIVVAVTVLFLLGYRLDGLNGRLEQGALLQFNSTPTGALVWVDGVSTGGRTTSKRTILAGEHSFMMTRDGYEDWNRTLSVTAGTLTWLDYIRLVPKERTPETVANYSTLAGMKASPDLRTLITQERADQPIFDVVDIRAPEIRSTSITLPQSFYSEAQTPGVTHTFALQEWDQGGRYVLVTHTYNGTTEWLVVDTQNVALSSNISRVLSASFSEVAFAGTDGRQLYGLASDGVLRKLDLANSTLSRALVTHVSSFNVDPTTSIVSYVGANPDDTSKRVVGVYRDGDATGHILRSIDATDTSFLIATGRYFGDDYVAIAEGQALTVLKGSYPASSQAEVSSLPVLDTIDLGAPATDLSFSPKSAYIVAQSGKTFVGYELEHRRATSASIDTTSDNPVLHWLDIAHLWSDADGTLTMRDFDGSNAFNIMNVASGFDSTLSQNGRYFYAIGKLDQGYQLQRVKMILD